MSGDVALVDSADGSISHLVRTASSLFSTPDFAPTALVGGLAVTIRLATVHRATVDVDTVAEGEGPRNLALRYLGDIEAATTDRVEIDGVKVDVMATWPLPPTAEELPEEAADRLFVLGHRWALETATRVAVDVLQQDGATVATSGVLTVATVPALIACKLHAISDRRGSSAPKRESDALDLVRLIGEVIRSNETVDPFASAPFDLTKLVAHQVDHWFIGASLRLARLAGSASSDRLEPADVSALGRLFVDRTGQP